MGLFGKKEPCPICGGKLPMFLATKIEGQALCNECSSKLDVQGDIRDGMTLQGFKEYLVFYEQNCRLREQFIISQKVDFGMMDTKIIFDYEHKLFCIGKNPDRTVFEGAQLKSFTIKEDSAPLFEGSAAGLRRYTSAVPDKVMALAPQIAQFVMNQRLIETLDRMDDDDDKHSRSRRNVDIPEPFQQFNVELHLEHPYWNLLQCDMSGPCFSSGTPDAGSYMNDYARDIQTVEELVHALMTVAFPDAGECAVGGAAAACARPEPTQAVQPGKDPIEEIKRYKELMEQGLIDADEFQAKKKQLLGI